MGGKECCLAIGAFLLAAIILAGVLVGISLKRLETSEVAIQYNTFTKELHDEPFYEGLHLGPPNYQWLKFSSVFKTLTYSGLRCLNMDGVPIAISVSFQYRVRASQLMRVVEQFTDELGYGKILRNIGSSAVHDSCSVFNTVQFQSERGNFQEDLTFRLVGKFDRLGCDVTDLQVNDIRRPQQYENAIRDKESSREDIEVAQSERPKKLTEARTTKREAEKERDIIMNKARSDANIMLKRSEAEAQGILNDYQKEAESYKALKEANGLDNQGFLAYMGIRAISNAQNPVYVGMKAPAQTTFD